MQGAESRKRTRKTKGTGKTSFVQSVFDLSVRGDKHVVSFSEASTNGSPIAFSEGPFDPAKDELLIRCGCKRMPVAVLLKEEIIKSYSKRYLLLTFIQKNLVDMVKRVFTFAERLAGCLLSAHLAERPRVGGPASFYPRREIVVP